MTYICKLLLAFIGDYFAIVCSKVLKLIYWWTDLNFCLIAMITKILKTQYGWVEKVLLSVKLVVSEDGIGRQSYI